MLVDLHNYFATSPVIRKRVIGANFLSAEYNCPIDVENLTFWNEMHLITYAISGRKDWFVGGKKYVIEAGDAAFIRKGVYSTKQYFEVDHCVITFMLNDEFIYRFLQEYPSLKLPEYDEQKLESIYTVDVDESMQSIIYSVSNYLRGNQEIPLELVEIKFKELLFNLVLNPKNRSIATLFQSSQHSEKLDMEYTMNKNFQYDLGMEEFARLCGKSLSGFKRAFQEYFHETPGKWLKKKRLELAKSLLMNTSLNINEVCYDSGFKNTSHFNRAFKERYKLPPQQFRQNKFVN